MMDRDVEAIYREEHPFYTPRYTPIMKALIAGEPLSIKDIADRSTVSHSAASQTIARMVDHDLVRLTTAADKRSRVVFLSQKGRNLLPWLQKRWLATSTAAEELDRELPYPLSQLLSEAIQALESRSFMSRIRSHEPDEENAK